MNNSKNDLARTRARHLLVATLIIISAFSAYCQPITVNIPGTRLLLTPPADFHYERGLPGLVSSTDSSTIVVAEVTNPYSFDKLVAKRLLNMQALGIDTINFQKMSYDGYRGYRFAVNPQSPRTRSEVIMFGSDKFLVDIGLTAPEPRFEQLMRMVLTGKYDATIPDDFEKMLGFEVDLEGSDLAVFKKDGNTINTRKLDQRGNVMSWLNLTRMPANIYAGASAKEAIEATYNLYRFEKQFIRSDTLVVDNSELLYNLYTNDLRSGKELTFIGIIKKADFYLLVMAGSGNHDELDKLMAVVRTLKFSTW